MKTVELADTGRLAEELKSGEAIEIVEDGKTVAKVVPLDDDAYFAARTNDLEAQGLLHRGTGGTLPDDFFTRPLPRADKSVLEELLAERYDD